ncbi:Shedu anti-phage system protein SduA domain-containing protein [Henriciella mobilis]|uniref:DUF4263 domain-containing protein n=1 Tax=Henriciella mobilis TaxID=2305467 RepID=A0A399R917_9PROT|nr:Shedu anti-phage system protein SduA domain-containing protein [Henriciella mobilis]RIJ26417.1 DUF4263 domain-containing protein [Henriciella mobilis]
MAQLLDEYDFRLSSDGCGHLHYLIDFDGSPTPHDIELDLYDCPALSVDLKNDHIVLHARDIAAGPPLVHLNFRYRKIRQLILEGFGTAAIRDEESALRFVESELPSQFRQSLRDGLGLEHQYTSLVEEIEDGCSAHRMIVSRNRPSQLDSKINALVLSERDFQEVCRQIDDLRYRSKQKLYSDQRNAVYNHFAPFLARQDKPRQLSKARVIQDIESVFENEPIEATSKLAGFIGSSANTLIDRIPERIKVIRERVELAFLDAFIEKFENRITENLPEADWQKFFIDNPIALSSMFNSSVLMISDRPFVGGTDIEGRGGKKSDFLFKNYLTGNLSFIEIKTPQKEVVSARDDYSNGMYPAHSDLSLAVSQVIDQRNKFQDEFATLFLKSPDKQLTSYAIRCYAVIGTVPLEDDRKKSFEHVRDNLTQPRKFRP